MPPEVDMIGKAVQLGAAGAVIFVVVLFLKHLRAERKEEREHQEKVFDKVAESSSNSTEQITGAITGLTSVVQDIHADTKGNMSECKSLRGEVQEVLAAGRK